MKKILFIHILFFNIIVSYSQSVTINNIVYQVTSPTEVEVIDSPKATGNITILPTVNINEKDYNVISIGKYSFSNNQLTGLIIPNSITSIGEAAFYENQLTNVEIPNSVTNIEGYAFAYNQLTNLIIPNSLTSISEYAFTENQLTSVEIPNSVTSINKYAFTWNKLTSIEIPNSVTNIGEYAFKKNKLTSLIIPNSITSISEGAFTENQLTNLEIPNSVTSIGRAAFLFNKLTSLIIPNSVTSIGRVAFYENQLTNLEIPNSVTNIEEYAFAYNQLTSVITKNTTPLYISKNVFKENNISKATLYVPEGSLNIYQKTYAWNDFGTIKEQQVVSYKEINKDPILLYPNPTTNNITLQLDNNIYSITILNSLGENIYTTKSNGKSEIIILTNNFTNGIYFVKIEGINKIKTLKFIKK